MTIMQFDNDGVPVSAGALEPLWITLCIHATLDDGINYLSRLGITFIC